MAGLRPIWVAIFLVGLFTFSALAFTYQFISANNSNSALLNDSTFNNTYISLNNTLSSFQSAVQTQQNLTASDKKTSSVSIFLILDSILTTPWNLMNLAFSLLNIIQSFILAQLFGNNVYIMFTVLIGILTGTVIFLVIKFIRTGESER